MFSLNWERDRNVHSHLFWSPCIRGLKHCNKARKNKFKNITSIKMRKEKLKVKLPLFAHDTIAYIKNPEESINKLV